MCVVVGFGGGVGGVGVGGVGVRVGVGVGIGGVGCVVVFVEWLLIATLKVARLTVQTRKLWWMSGPTVTRVTFDLPECKEPFEKKKKKRKQKKKQETQ